MALGKLTAQGYYKGNQIFQGDGTTKTFTLTDSFFDPIPTVEGEFSVYIDNTLIPATNYTYASPVLTFGSVDRNSNVQAVDGAPLLNKTVSIELVKYDQSYGNYQNIKLKDIVNNFMIGYVGDGKLIDSVKRSDVLFHAQRGVQELSYDALRSESSQEIEVSPSLSMPLPHDYVNYVNVSWVSNSGDEYILHPIRKSSNPEALLQDSDYNYIFDADGKLTTAENSETWKRFKTNTSTEASKEEYWYTTHPTHQGTRYGLFPEFAQENGCFLIDQARGLIHFTSNVSGKVVILKYISDGIYGDTLIHKFAEEAIYKHVAYAVLSNKINVPEYIINRHKRERRAAIRNAKIRLSNLKVEELTQVMRGKAKRIK